MTWQPLNQLTLTQEWQFTDPIQGEYFKLTHSNLGSVARCMICQATVINDKLFLYQVREISANQDEIIKIENNQIFDNRRIGFCQNYGALNWVLQIDEFIPEDPEDAVIDLGTNKHTRSVAKPTSPITGDTWDELASDGSWVLEWFWNGTYWLSRQIFTLTGASLGATGGDFVSANSSTGMGSPAISPKPYNLFLLNFTASVFVNGTNTTANFWTVTLARRSSVNVATTISSFTTQADAPSVRTTKNIALNLHLDLTALDIRMFRTEYATTGTPGTLQVMSHLTYRWARP